MRPSLQKAAQHMYGMIHARFLLTMRGMQKMVCRSFLACCFVLTTFSLINSAKAALGHVRVPCAGMLTLFRWVFQMYVAKAPLKYTVLAVRISILRRQHDIKVRQPKFSSICAFLIWPYYNFSHRRCILRYYISSFVLYDVPSPVGSENNARAPLRAEDLRVSNTQPQ